MPCSSYDHSKVETENRYPEQTIQSEVARGYPGDDHLGVYFGRNPKRGVDECLRLLHTRAAILCNDQVSFVKAAPASSG